jgi:catechol 2,3-dioxygenase-like lactoylglutathione lyase family enzyme
MGRVPARFDHLTVTASDFAASRRFYDAALAAVGWVRVVELSDEEEDDAPVEAAAWAPVAGEPPQIWLVSGRHPTRGVHLALRMPDAPAVQAFYAAALAAGGASHDAPRRWPIYRRGEYHAIVTDPDGNLIETIAPE